MEPQEIQKVYDLLDTYAVLRDVSFADALDCLRSGQIGGYELLDAYLEDEGIFGYTDTLVEIIRVVGKFLTRDGRHW